MQKVPAFTGDDLLDLLETAKDPARRLVFLLGAGASKPCLPEARELREAILSLILERAGEAQSSGELSEEWVKRIHPDHAPHLTLEVLCSLIRYRAGQTAGGKARFEPARLWKETTANAAPSRTVRAIALLAKAGLVRAVITSNFDALVPEALDDIGVPFRVITNKDPELSGDPRLPCVAFHGTVYQMNGDDPASSPYTPPSTALARGLATPLSPAMRRTIETLIAPPTPVLAIGYSGSDHYDVNLFLRARVGGEQTKNWHWFSYDERVEQNFSPLIREKFKASIRQADSAELLSSYCRARWGSALSDPGSVSWRASLKATFDSFGLRRELCREIASDLRNNLTGAWVVLEHYYLFSSVYDAGTALVFGGVDEEREAQKANAGQAPAPSHLEVLGTDWGSLLEAQYEYRKEQAESRKLSKLDKCEFPFARTSALLVSALASLEKQPSLPASGLRAVDRAVVLVGRAFAEDYLGLIPLQRAVALDELLVSEKVDDEKRYEWLTKREAERLEARKRFLRCMELAREACTVLAAANESPPELDELVQHHIWGIIGKENWARALPVAESLPVFREAIEERRQLIAQAAVRGLDEYRMSHHPQIWLRASEMMKRVLGISGDTDPPAPYSTLDEQGRDDFEFALSAARASYEDYASVGEINARYPGYFETKMLAAAAQGDFAAAERELKECEAVPRERFVAAEGWIENMRERLRSMPSSAR